MNAPRKLRLVIAKGRIYKSVAQLLHDAGVQFHANDRDYRVTVSNLEIEIKMMKPQNIPKLIELGSHDAGFTGKDWIVETASNVEEVMDLGFDPVSIVVAVPEEITPEQLRRQQLVVASEYAHIATSFLDRQGYDYVLLKTFGATEVFPPDDADMIIDNTSTGRTLQEHHLKIIQTIMTSSTRFITNRAVLDDPWKTEKIHQMRLLFESTLAARERVMLEMNVPKEHFDETIKILPCMRSPTVAPLYGEAGYAVKVAVKKGEVIHLIPRLKTLGVTDILEYELRKVIA
ncbi:ATP phosphoribosyltransferase [candidate division KSB3 bacterium]|uniref:ATP phosphoribosyltransferase n=1 Tax=candidate division KSB3 bacterium TaxID=2044937 RepID=A0A9D5JU59_9BACT|nr:ATP phosphoribosyltransferase [candidate division KSB3 bacterium]MBD3324145.1 ATP phosphoribosyltransferase [candidate division KSB3 bacterium]